MEEGLIKTKPLSNDVIGSGTIAILKTDTLIVPCKVEHITPDNEWVVLYDNLSHTVASNEQLCSLVILLLSEITRTIEYPLKRTEWKKACENKWVNQDEIKYFEMTPNKFKTGLYDRTCTECGGYFLGASSQATCKMCCEKHTEAILVTTAPSSKKRKRLISLNESKVREEAAFNAARIGECNFEEWYNKKY